MHIQRCPCFLRSAHSARRLEKDRSLTGNTGNAPLYPAKSSFYRLTDTQTWALITRQLRDICVGLRWLEAVRRHVMWEAEEGRKERRRGEEGGHGSFSILLLLHPASILHQTKHEDKIAANRVRTCPNPRSPPHAACFWRRVMKMLGFGLGARLWRCAQWRPGREKRPCDTMKTSAGCSKPTGATLKRFEAAAVFSILPPQHRHPH